MMLKTGLGVTQHIGTFVKRLIGYKCLADRFVHTKNKIQSNAPIATEFFGNSNREFCTFRTIAADEPWTGRTHPSRLVSRAVAVYADTH